MHNTTGQGVRSQSLFFSFPQKAKNRTRVLQTSGCWFTVASSVSLDGIAWRCACCREGSAAQWPLLVKQELFTRCVCKTFQWKVSSCFVSGIWSAGTRSSQERWRIFHRTLLINGSVMWKRGGCVAHLWHAPPFKTSSLINGARLRGQPGKCGFELILNECSF